MIAFVEMLINPAKEAGIKVPEDTKSYDTNKYPHFYVFSQVQLGAAMPSPTAHFENAKIIASIPNNKIRKITYKELFNQGLKVG